MNHEFVQVVGIKFFNGKAESVLEYLNKSGGLLTVPAAPALVTVKQDRAYYNALLHSDIVIPDSSYMVLIWNIFFKNSLKKISGLEFINCFLKSGNKIEKNKLLLINPSNLDGEINTQYLNSCGFTINEMDNYTAPLYKNDVADLILLAKVEKQKPSWILINIGGGTQEKLGLFLKLNLSYSPAILCTGAALAFKTGRQGKIPNWIDKIYLGWLHRCFSNPKVFIPRYFRGFKLINIIFRYKSEPIG
jgi:N-acetylglucosaminyldiphosphoundecaprenol N-acetyl-beta-D-mannosaminyltransferase